MVEQTAIIEQRHSNADNFHGAVGGRWTEGQSGNPAGRKPNSVTTLLKNRSPEDNKKIADKLYQMAINGDMAAIREYIDRTDGRVTGDLPAFNDNRQLTINVVGTEGKKLLEEIAKGIKPHKEIGSG